MAKQMVYVELGIKNEQLFEESTFKDGEIDGLCRSWYENGQLWMECTYKDGEKDGLCRRWHENGQLDEEYTFKDGIRSMNLSKFCIDVNDHTSTIYTENIKDEVCCICLDNLEENVCKLSCDHMYHLNCIETYLNNVESKLNCCLCKQPINLN